MQISCCDMSAQQFATVDCGTRQTANAMMPETAREGWADQDVYL